MDKPRAFSYNGKTYSEAYYADDAKHYDGNLSDLLSAIEKDNPNVYHERALTIRYVGNEYFGTDDEKDDEETLDELIEIGYDDCIGLSEVKEETNRDA